MSYIKIKGVVIKEVNTGEADKIITILSREKGRISCYAKGARRSKSSLVAGTQFLCYSEFSMFKGRDMYSLNSSEVLESFYDIRTDIEKLTYAAHMVDIIGDVVQEEQPSARVLQLFLNTLHFLSRTQKPPELLARIFEFRLLGIIGYAPQVSGCTCCYGMEFDETWFSFQKCGFICRACRDGDKSCQRILPGTAKALNHIIHSKTSELFNFNVSQAVMNELERLSKKYMRDRLEKDYTKLDYLKSLQNI